MAKKKTEVVVVDSGVESFENTKVMFVEISEQVMQIKVSDTSSLAIANQKMSFVNNHLKEIEAKRVEQKAPHMAKAKAVDDVAKELKSLLEPALAHLKKQVGDWQLDVIRKENELKQKALEEARKAEEAAKSTSNQARIVNYISQVKDWLEKGLDACVTIEHGQQVLSSMEGLQPKEMMGEYQTEYTALIEMYTKLFRTKLGELEGKIAKGTTQNHINVLGGQLNDHIDSLKEQIQTKEQQVAVVNAEILNEMATLQEEKASNVAFLWRFELVDIKSVPLEWLMLDEKKVKDWLSYSKENLKEEVISGVRFYKEISVRTK